MKNEDMLLGIYDECKLYTDLLHNKLDHMGYSVLFSCNTPERMFEYLTEHVSLLLVGATNRPDRLLRLIREVRRRCHFTIKILAYVSDEHAVSKDDLITVGANEVVSPCSYQSLIKKLEIVLPEHPLHRFNGMSTDDITPAVLPSSNPFYDIVNDRYKYDVLRLAAKGFSTKDIAAVLGLDFNPTETIRKQIIKDSNSKNITEAVAKAKDLDII